MCSICLRNVITISTYSNLEINTFKIFIFLKYLLLITHLFDRVRRPGRRQNTSNSSELLDVDTINTRAEKTFNKPTSIRAIRLLRSFCKNNNNKNLCLIYCALLYYNNNNKLFGTRTTMFREGSSEMASRRCGHHTSRILLEKAFLYFVVYTIYYVHSMKSEK